MTCTRCGAKLKEGAYVYSSWTKNRYCARIDACSTRAKRIAKRETT